MSYTLKKVSLPYFGEIPGGVQPGKQIILKGKVKGSCERFNINLECNCEPGGNVAFHFNPRQSEGEVVRNSYDGEWGSEERDQPYFPFNPKDRFEIRILAMDECYRVYVNDDKFIDYYHRMPICDVHSLTIDGDIKVSELKVLDNLQLPFLGGIHGGLHVGKAICVKGVTGSDPNRFSMNFRHADDSNSFHFNPRFEEGVVVRNSLFDGSWGDEERDQEMFPFVAGQMFDVTFYILDDFFRVFVNGEHYTDFNYRCPFEDITRFEVEGDVELVSIQYLDAMGEHMYEPIGKGLKCCDSVRLKGFVKLGADRFDINLREKSSEDTDSPSESDEELSPEPNISLHFNPRACEGEVVENTKECSEWGGEERAGLPRAFEPGQPFDIRIMVHDTHYQIFVNGEHFNDYNHRLPYNRVKFVQFSGDAWFNMMEVNRNKELPQSVTVPGEHLTLGQSFVVSGVVNPDADRFDFNLVNPDNEEVLLHFNPRFGEDVVVRNTKSDGWEEEEREQMYFPFRPGQLFEVVVQVKDDGYVLCVDGQHFANFSHRRPYYDVGQITMDGDATFFKVQFL